MTERVTRISVQFLHAFDPGGDYGVQPAGTYDVETVEEQLDSISFIAYRRISTTMVRRAAPDGRARPSSMMIDPADLERALAADAVTGARRPAPAVR